MTIKMLVLASTMLIFASCCKAKEPISNQDEAIKVSNAYLSKQVPQMRLDELQVDVDELSDRWRISYRPRDGGTGGLTILVINKRSGEVVHMEAEQ